MIEGSTEPREPERGRTLERDRPSKDGSDHGLMRPRGERMQPAEAIEGGDPRRVYAAFGGEGVKTPPQEERPPVGRGEQRPLQVPVDDRYARVSFDIVSGEGVSPRRAVVIDGTPTRPRTLKGTYVWRAEVDGVPVEVGSFLDPLELSTAVPDPVRGPGHSPPAKEGTFRITLSSRLLEAGVLSRARLDFFRLDRGLPPDTALNPETVGKVIDDGRGTRVGSVPGARVSALLRAARPTEPR